MLTFDQAGKIVPLAKDRTLKQSLKHIVRFISESQADFNLPMRISVVDANNPEQSQAWVRRFHEQFPNATISTDQISPAITVHTGEKAMGVVWDIDWQSLV
jgi:fatty acid-binding protein DegV